MTEEKKEDHGRNDASATASAEKAEQYEEIGKLYVAAMASGQQQMCDLGNGETLSYRILPPKTVGTHQEQRPSLESARFTMICLPGYSCDGESMAGILRTFPAFDDHCLIGVNPRGYGSSTFHEAIWTHEEFAEDIKLFLDALNVQRAMICGYSTGGATAAALALMCPDKIQAVFMMNAIPFNGVEYNLNLDGTPKADPMCTHEDAKNLATALENTGLHSGVNDPPKWHAIASAMMPPLPSLDHPIMKDWAVANHNQRCRAHAQYANQAFNITPIQTHISPPSMVLKDLKVPLIVYHGEKDVTVNTMQVEAVTKLAIARRWASSHPTPLISYYEHPGHHFPFFACRTEWNDGYRRALTEQVIDREQSG